MNQFISLYYLLLLLLLQHRVVNWSPRSSNHIMISTIIMMWCFVFYKNNILLLCITIYYWNYYFSSSLHFSYYYTIYYFEIILSNSQSSPLSSLSPIIFFHVEYVRLPSFASSRLYWAFRTLMTSIDGSRICKWTDFPSLDHQNLGARCAIPRLPKPLAEQFARRCRAGETLLTVQRSS